MDLTGQLSNPPEPLVRLWYTYQGQDFWLCPALLDWFESAPKRIFVRAKEPDTLLEPLRCSEPPLIEPDDPIFSTALTFFIGSQPPGSTSDINEPDSSR
jgi:hypothetical protein